MSLHTEWIHYGNGHFKGYLAQPSMAVGSLPAILVIQEIWGVDKHIEDITRRFAQAGYVAFAPDLFARNGNRPDELSYDRIEALKSFLDTLPPTAWRNTEEREAYLLKLPQPKQQQTRESVETVFGSVLTNMEQFLEPLVFAASFLRNEYPVTKNQSIASVGFCMGGALSALLACNDKELKGAVIYYGTAPRADLLSDIQCPLIGLYGELDQRITDGVPGFAQAMQEAGKSFEYHIYPQAPHAFFNDTRGSYHPAAARDAFVRTLSFFNQHLG